MMKPIALTVTFATTLLLIFSFQKQADQRWKSAMSKSKPRSFIVWLHGLGDSGPANEPIKTLFTSPDFSNTTWFFPSAPSKPVSCNQDKKGDWSGDKKGNWNSVRLLFINPMVSHDGAVMPSWFDIHEIPITAASPKDESGVLKAVQNVHAVIDKEVAAGTNPENIFVCGFSQGGALTLASVLLYPKTLGGGAVFSGWVPFSSAVIGRVTPNARKTPFIWSHGIADRTVLFEAGQAGPPFLEQTGMSCEFKAYPGLGHSISTEELKSLESWIRARLKSSS